MDYLGVDLGSSYLKGAVLDLDGLAVRHIERAPLPEPVAGLPAAFREFDPGEVVAASRALLERLLRRAPEAQGCVICSQLHGLVFSDDRGRPLSNIINWQDQRALQPFGEGRGTYFDEINRRITGEERRQLGNEPRPGVPLCFSSGWHRTGLCLANPPWRLPCPALLPPISAAPRLCWTSRMPLLMAP